MDHKKNKTNFDKNLVSTNETNSLSLYGLTPVSYTHLRAHET